MKEKKQNDIAVLLNYAGSYKGLTFAGLALSAVAMILGMAPYICIWLVARDLIAVAPNWTEAVGISRYGWMAFAFAVGGIAVYFAALMCTHLAAFRTAANIRKQGMAHLMKTPLGFFDSNASGLLRNRLDGAASETETLLAHKRIKLDWLLEAGKHHSTKFWYVRLYLIMMVIHMTSWNLPT